MQQIQVGQRWRTRGGKIVYVTADRGDASHNNWRWACSNSEIAHDPTGRVSINPQHEHANDLVELLEDLPSKKQVEGMDSQMGSLGP